MSTGVSTGSARGTGVCKEPRNSPERHHGQADAMRRLSIKPFYSTAPRTSSDNRANKGPWKPARESPRAPTVGQRLKTPNWRLEAYRKEYNQGPSSQKGTGRGPWYRNVEPWHGQRGWMHLFNSYSIMGKSLSVYCSVNFSNIYPFGTFKVPKIKFHQC